MHDEDFVRHDLVKTRQCNDRLTGTIHERRRFQQPEITQMADMAEEFALWRKRDLEVLRQPVDKPETEVMAIIFVFRSRIPETNDKTWDNDGHGSQSALTKQSRRR